MTALTTSLGINTHENPRESGNPFIEWLTITELEGLMKESRRTIYRYPRTVDSVIVHRKIYTPTFESVVKFTTFTSGDFSQPSGRLVEASSHIFSPRSQAPWPNWSLLHSDKGRGNSYESHSNCDQDVYALKRKIRRGSRIGHVLGRWLYSKPQIPILRGYPSLISCTKAAIRQHTLRNHSLKLDE